MLKNKVYIFDNLLPSTYQDYVEKVCYGHLPFYIVPKPSLGPREQTEYFNLKDKIYDKSQMNHALISQSQSYYSLHSTLSSPLFTYLQSYFNFKFNYSILRSKVNLKHQQPIKFQKLFNPPHVDFEPPLPNTWILLYYVNNSDGDTIIFNETYNSLNTLQNFSIHKSITPQKGRIVFFPANMYHSANFPTINNSRIVINNVMQVEPLKEIS
tara:strand:- start:88 stop:720 length:633 start_codon:yes stop_codon:yes gene_type:complete